MKFCVESDENAKFMKRLIKGLLGLNQRDNKGCIALFIILYSYCIATNFDKYWLQYSIQKCINSIHVQNKRFYTLCQNCVLHKFPLHNMKRKEGVSFVLIQCKWTWRNGIIYIQVYVLGKQQHQRSKLGNINKDFS